jgi:hypothetical protein
MLAHATLDARPGWTEGLKDLPPGAHVAVLGARPSHCMEGRRAGLEFRDTILLVTAKGLSAAALFRLPFDGTVATQMTKTATGGLWVDGCRVSTTPSDDIFAKNPTQGEGSDTGTRKSMGTAQEPPTTTRPPDAGPRTSSSCTSPAADARGPSG